MINIEKIGGKNAEITLVFRASRDSMHLIHVWHSNDNNSLDTLKEQEIEKNMQIFSSHLKIAY